MVENTMASSGHSDDAVTQGEDLVNFYGSGTADMYDSMMDDEMKKVVDDLEFVAQNLPKDGHILDTCVGTGHYLAYFSSSNRKLVGTDISESMLEKAKKRLPGATLGIHDMLQPSEGGCAAVFNNFALHHATNDQARRAIRMWAEMLVPNGLLYVSVWEGSGKIDYGEEMKMDSLLIAQSDLEAWISEAGLDIMRKRNTVEHEMGDMKTAYVVARKKAS